MSSVGVVSFFYESSASSVRSCFLLGEMTLISPAGWIYPSQYKNNPVPVVRNTIDKIESIITTFAIFAYISFIFSAGLVLGSLIIAPIVLKGIVFSKAAFLAFAALTALIGLGSSSFESSFQTKLTRFKYCCAEVRVFDFPKTMDPNDIRSLTPPIV